MKFKLDKTLQYLKDIREVEQKVRSGFIKIQAHNKLRFPRVNPVRSSLIQVLEVISTFFLYEF